MVTVSGKGIVAYKKLIYDEGAPRYPLALSPVYGTPWALKDGLLYHSVPHELVNLQTSFGIYSIKSPHDERLNSYYGYLVELQIGGVVIEGEHGYRSSEAAVTRVFEVGNVEYESAVLADALIKYANKLPSEHLEYIVHLLYRQEKYFALDMVERLCRFSTLSMVHNVIRNYPQYPSLDSWRRSLSYIFPRRDNDRW